MRSNMGSGLAVAPLLAVPLGASQAPAIIEAGWCYDGSSLRVVYTDATGSVATCCFDHRPGTTTAGRIYLNAGQPEAAKAWPASAFETRIIVGRLRAAIDAVYPPEAQASLLRKRYDTEVSSLDYEAWLILRELQGHGES